MKNEKRNAAQGGIGFWGLLQLALIILKLCNVIMWSWWAVLAPVIAGTGLAVIALIVIVACEVIEAHSE